VVSGDPAAAGRLLVLLPSAPQVLLRVAAALPHPVLLLLLLPPL
jgi:hypothetical protein